MAAFNWVVLIADCPVCRQVSRIRCQTHVASSYSGDESGRFHDREYQLGERMAWWPSESGEFADWRDENLRMLDGDHGVEACYSECEGCGAELYALIRFCGPRAEALEGLGTPDHWPEGYPR